VTSCLCVFVFGYLELMDKGKPQSNFYFKSMSLIFRIRDLIDLILPRRDVLEEVGIKPGFHVLDYGCGPGGYISALGRLLGTSGKIYALDMHPLAIRAVQKIALREKIENLETIHSDRETGLPDNSLDVVLLYDVFHGLSNPDGVLEEIHRVLKPDGILSFSDHHISEDEIISRVTETGLFRLSGKGNKTYSFLREEQKRN
jgi:ubiquinone/menaquinone biosynthesis C-methylase UbiE